MSLEDEMAGELRKMERQITEIDKELEKLRLRVNILSASRYKLCRDSDALQSYFHPEERKIKQTTLAGLMK